MRRRVKPASVLALALAIVLPMEAATAGLSYQPDVYVAGNTGEGVYDATGSGQVKNVMIRRGRSRELWFWTRNDGQLSDYFTYWGCNLGGGVRMSWRDYNGNNITEPVTAGTYGTPLLTPGVSEVPAILKIRIKRSAREGHRYDCGLSAESFGDGTIDVAMYRIRVR